MCVCVCVCVLTVLSLQVVYIQLVHFMNNVIESLQQNAVLYYEVN